MVSPLAAYGARRPSVQVYGSLPQPYRPPSPPSVRPTPTGPAPHRDPLMAATSALNASRASQSGGGDQGGQSLWGKGLGFAINNPLTQAAVESLNVLDYGRRGVTLGVEEWLESITGETNPDDERSNWEKLNDPEYGVGQIIPDTGNQWVDRAMGFTGDVLLDPLTYVGVGAITKTGGTLNKAARAGMATQLLDAGLPEQQVINFVRKGPYAKGVTDAVREAAGMAQPGLRVGTKGANFVVPGTQKLTEVGSRAAGALGARGRAGRVGEAIARTRTPERVEDAYERLFNAKGNLSFSGAAERVDIENRWRRQQNAFRNVADRDTRGLRRKLRRLDGERGRRLLNSIEYPDRFSVADDAQLDKLRQEMVDAFEGMWSKAQDQGLNFKRRQRYTPHILTRDASKWIRNQGDDTTGARHLVAGDSSGLVTEDLYDPSGVTMARQFRPGQELTVNGNKVTLETGTIDEVNSKFREAGLDFDFYETDPGVILDKYINMLSSDVGEAAGILGRADKGGGVRRLTERQMELLGLRPDEPVSALGEGAPLASRADEAMFLGAERASAQGEQFRVPGSGKMEPEADLERISRITGEELDPELFQAARATGKEVSLTKRGKPRLSKQGIAKDLANREALENGGSITPFVEDDFVWRKNPTQPKKTYNNELVESARKRQVKFQKEYEDQAREVEKALDEGKAIAETTLVGSFKKLTKRIDDLNRQMDKIARMQRAGTARTAQLEEWIDEIDTFQEAVLRDIRNLDQAAQRDATKAGQTAVQDRMARLRDESDRLRRRLTRLLDTVGGEEGLESANAYRRRAAELREQVEAPGRAAREQYDMLMARKVDDAGLPDLERQITELRQQGLPNEELQPRLAPLMEERRQRMLAINSDPEVVKARRDVATTEALAARRPSTKATSAVPNVGGPPNKPELVPPTGRAAGRRGQSAVALDEADARFRAIYSQAEDAWIEADDEIKRIAAEVAKDPEVINAKRALRRVPGMGPTSRVSRSEQMTRDLMNSGRKRRLEARIKNAERAAEERLGLPEAKRKAEKAQQIMNMHTAAEQTMRGRGQGELAYTLDEVRANTEKIRAAWDEGLLGELAEARRQASRSSAVVEREIGERSARRREVQQEIADIVQGGPAGKMKRAQVVAEEQEAARAARIAAQEPRRTAIKKAREWADPMYLTPRRRQYVEELAQIDEDQAARLTEMATVLNDSAAQRDLRQQTAERVSRLNEQMAPTVGKGDEAKPRPKPLYGESEKWAADVNVRAQELRDLLALPDEVLDPEAKVAIEKLLNDVIDGAVSAKQADVTAEKFRELRQKGKAGQLGRVIEARLAEGWDISKPALLGDDVALSAELRQSFQRVREAGFHKDFIPLLDTMTNLFKTYATLTPGFHLRNAMSAAFMNASDGVTVTEQLRAMRLFRQYRRSKNPAKWLEGQPEAVRGAFEAAFGSGIGGRYTEPGIGSRGQARFKLVEALFDNPLTRTVGERPGANIEGIVRLAPALHTLEKGGTIEEALERVTRLHFDYSQMSRFDRNARRLIPFWTFMSRNLPLQVTQMWTKPRAYAKYNSFVRNFKGESLEGEPDYFGPIGAFRFGDAELGGLPMYLQPDLAHTRLTEDLERWGQGFGGDNPGQVLSDFTPFLTAPVEYATGTNLYTGRRYDPEDVRETSALETPISLLGRLFDQTQETPGGATVTSERFIDAMRSLVPVYDRAVRLAPTTVSRDPDAGDRQLESILRFLGVPVRQLSDAQRESTLAGRYYDQLDQLDIQQALAEIDAMRMAQAS